MVKESLCAEKNITTATARPAASAINTTIPTTSTNYAAHPIEINTPRRAIMTNTPRTPRPPPLSSPLLLLLLVLSVLHHLPRYAHAILPTAAIDIHLPGTSSSEVITLLASQASFGGSVARYDQRHGGGGGGGGAEGVVGEGEDSSSSSPHPPAGVVADGVGVVPAFPPDDDPYLCNESEGLADYSPGRMMSRSTALLVPRGRCSFEAKALSAQRLGASIAIVYGTLSSRYSLNYTNSTPDATEDDSRTRSGYTNDDVVWPKDKFDYDCDMGSAHLPREEYERLNFVKLPGGYDEGNNDAMLTGIGSGDDVNMCVKYDDSSSIGDTTSSVTNGGKKKKSFASACESQRCLVTGRNVTRDDGGATMYEACCAWDLHVWLYGDSAVTGGGKNEKVTIPAVYITMEESSLLLDMVRGAKASSSSSSSDPIVITVYERSRPTYNASAFLIWALGVFVAWASSYGSSHEIRKAGRTLVAYREYKERRLDAAERGGADGGGRRGGGGPSSSSSSSSSSPPASYGGGDERTIYRAPADDDDDDGGASTGPGSSSAAAAAQHRAERSQHQEESLELTAAHAAGFLISSSASLLILFFFKIYNVVKIMYAFGCSGAFAQVMVHPGLTHLCRMLRYDHPTRNFACLSGANVSRETARGGGARGKCLGCLRSFLGPVSPLDVAAAVLSYGVGAVWLWVGFAVPHPGTVAFYWIVQNVFGMCMCMLFLDTIKLNAIKVGAVLLIVAFFYDIFFVFLTPFLTKHGESIMVNVATSGGPPKADPAWCEKYPFDANCRGGDPLPMLFAIPRIGDYQGGSSMLGLGDIFLPGLLLSFASRFDESKRLMGMVSGGSGRVVANNACPVSAGATQGRNGRSSNPLSFLCSCCFSNGYFGPVMVAYAIGLFMANAAVYIMEMGQPALLYLVPCCLGTMVCMGRRAG